MADDDDFFPDDEAEDGPSLPGSAAVPWHVLIVDDEPGVHQVTRLALAGATFKDRPIDLISCYSGKEARALMGTREDIALILLDVVMESDHAGLDLARAVREELGNHQVRIILRTGQPGLAPERQVIESYDINDYKAKTELTREKLYTAMIGTLRSYADILTIEHSRRVIDANRQGLLRIIDASSSVMRLQTRPALRRRRAGATEPAAVSGGGGASACNGGWRPSRSAGHSLSWPPRGSLLAESTASCPRWRHPAWRPRSTRPSPKAERPRRRPFRGLCARTARRGQHPGHRRAGRSVGGGRVPVGALLPQSRGRLREPAAAGEIEQTQRDIIYRLGEVVETRSKETGNHVRRLAEYSYILARAIGLDDGEAEILRTASPCTTSARWGLPTAS